MHALTVHLPILHFEKKKKKKNSLLWMFCVTDLGFALFGIRSLESNLQAIYIMHPHEDIYLSVTGDKCYKSKFYVLVCLVDVKSCLNNFTVNRFPLDSKT